MAQGKKKKFKVILSPTALEELGEIETYQIANHSLERALKITRSIFEKLELICLNPLSFPVFSNPIKPVNLVLRKAIVHSTYIIIFRIFEDEVQVMKIFHGSRNPQLLDEVFE